MRWTLGGLAIDCPPARLRGRCGLPLPPARRRRHCHCRCRHRHRIGRRMPRIIPRAKGVSWGPLGELRDCPVGPAAGRWGGRVGWLGGPWATTTDGAKLPSFATSSSWSGISTSSNSVAARSSLRFKSPDAGAHGMAGLSSLRAGPRSSHSLPRSTSAVQPLASSQVAVRLTNPLFRCAKLRKIRPLLAAALEVSKDGSSSVLANTLPSKGAIETLRNADAVCFDVDSTVILDEGIDELADFCGAGKAVAEWTAKAMTGTVLFEEALAARLSLIKPSLSQVEECLKTRPPRISPGMADLVKKLKSNNIDVFLVSGGFRQMIKPVAFELGIPPENITANQLLFGTSGEYAGFDPAEPTSRSGGKAKAVQQIKQDHGYKTVVMIGDGATDLEARQPGGADLFICYAGVQMREPVAAEADWVVFDFQELITKLP